MLVTLGLAVPGAVVLDTSPAAACHERTVLAVTPPAGRNSEATPFTVRATPTQGGCSGTEKLYISLTGVSCFEGPRLEVGTAQWHNGVLTGSGIVPSGLLAGSHAVCALNRPGIFTVIDDGVGAGCSSGPVLSVGDVSVHEGDAGTRGAVFTVSLCEPAPSDVTVDYATAEDTAFSDRPVDFTAKAGTLSFSPGMTSLTVKVPVVGETLDERDESFGLALFSPTGATIGDGTGVGTILDNDSAEVSGRRLAIGDVSLAEGDGGTRTAVLNVSLSTPASSTVTVNYSTVDDSATSPEDYLGKTGTLSFPAGVTSLGVKVTTNADSVPEANENFNVVLSGLSGPKTTIFDGTGVGTIIDND